MQYIDENLYAQHSTHTMGWDYIVHISADADSTTFYSIMQACKHIPMLPGNQLFFPPHLNTEWFYVLLQIFIVTVHIFQY